MYVVSECWSPPGTRPITALGKVPMTGNGIMLTVTKLQPLSFIKKPEKPRKTHTFLRFIKNQKFVGGQFRVR